MITAMKEAGNFSIEANIYEANNVLNSHKTI